MKVSGFLALLVLGILVAPLVSEAQPRAKIPQVGFLHHSRQADERQLRRLEAFRHGLGDLGYVEGQSILLEVRWSEGHLDRLAELAADLVRHQVDVLVVYGRRQPTVRFGPRHPNHIVLLGFKSDGSV
jgi:putative tryptophan/tyrosine transport system substrate-binding protein